MSTTQPAFPESRRCRHRPCNRETEVHGTAFETLSNPLSNVQRAWCESCKAFFPLADFQWADTNEGILDYATRHSARATALERYLCSPAFVIVCASAGVLFGGTIGYFLFLDKAVVVRAFIAAFSGGITAFIFVSLQDTLVNKLLVWRICGVVDSRLLK